MRTLSLLCVLACFGCSANTSPSSGGDAATADTRGVDVADLLDFGSPAATKCGPSTIVVRTAFPLPDGKLIRSAKIASAKVDHTTTPATLTATLEGGGTLSLRWKGDARTSLVNPYGFVTWAGGDSWCIDGESEMRFTSANEVVFERFTVAEEPGHVADDSFDQCHARATAAFPRHCPRSFNTRRASRCPRDCCGMSNAALRIRTVTAGDSWCICTRTMSFELDTVHTHVGFSVKHMMVSTVRGQFTSYRGKLELDTADFTKSKFEGEIDVESITTGNEQRDAHLRTNDFFDAPNHPKITFKSTRIESRGDNEFLVTGDLTIRGVTKEVALEVEWSGTSKNPYGKTVAGLSARATINRKDFGVNFNALLETGGVAVGEKVKLELEIEAVSSAAAA